MSLAKNYDPKEVEPRIENFWEDQKIYRFNEKGSGEIYSIDTPPPTVSGILHLGHVYSYSHTDFVARFHRMRGNLVFYPMGFDDNGLPTEYYVEKRLGKKAWEFDRNYFIQKCLDIGEEAEGDYRNLWQRLGLSIDWSHTYRTNDINSRKIAQKSFVDLYRKGLVIHREAPALWCTECRASVAQADLDDLDRESSFVTLAFKTEAGNVLPIATTRPELLPACVGVFVHPGDARHKQLVGQKAILPLYEREVPIMEDIAADPDKGTGVVMCCTFGDATDVSWWYQHKLELIQVIGSDGRMTEASGDLKGLPIKVARQMITAELEKRDLILDRQVTNQTIRVHERCDTPIEYVIAKQWFVNILDHKQALLEGGEKVNWYPEHMHGRYRAWVENLNWDWCLSRQRYFGIPFPVWYCKNCAEVILGDDQNLPVDPVTDMPGHPCPRCGGMEAIPEKDVMDTWATSSMSPQIAGKWLDKDQDLYRKVFPYNLRPQAHDIIRTWAFYTIFKSIFHFGILPWKDIAISGWGIAAAGAGKISKSRGGGPMAPLEMIDKYSADALRYWAASTSPGKDAVISEEKIQMGSKLATKLWNVSRFAERFIAGYELQDKPPSLSPADRWILSRLQKLVRKMTHFLGEYDYAAAKNELEGFFWTELADNYLEMCKQRLYTEGSSGRQAAIYTLYRVLTTTLQLFAPFLPYVTEEIYQNLVMSEAGRYRERSIHLTSWPEADLSLEDDLAEKTGEKLVEIATAVRRFKSEANLPLGCELKQVKLAIVESDLVIQVHAAREDLMSITRAKSIEVVERNDEGIEIEI